MSSDTATAPPRLRVLFVAEAVTLAHVARPHVLANALSGEGYETLFASDPRYDKLFADAQYRRRPIESVSSDRFLESLRKGSPLYDFATLQRYVLNDLAVIDEFQPDVVIGDFRLSLSTSARLRGVPYVAITNAYWSPQFALPLPVPELPLTGILGYRIGGALFRSVIPFAFAVHAKPHQQLRQHYGLAPLGWDVRKYYTDGDHVLYADPPDLVPLRGRPDHHQFIGPLQWSPKVALPDWWSEVGSLPKPIIYVTLGSSGASDVLPTIVHGLAEQAGTVLVATAGRSDLNVSAKNVWVADFLPGQEAAMHADLVVCNGGSPTAYQALAAGKPVLGVPSNLDQCLNMAALQAAGVGKMLRIGKLTRHSIGDCAFAAIQSTDSGRLLHYQSAIGGGDPVDQLCRLFTDLN